MLSLVVGIVNCGAGSDAADDSGAIAGGSGSSSTSAAGNNESAAGRSGTAGTSGNAGAGTGSFPTGGTNAAGASNSGGTSSSGNAGNGGNAMAGRSSGGNGGGGGAAMGGASSGGKAGTGGGNASGGAGTGGSTNTNTCMPGTTHTGGTQYCSNSTGNAGSGYSYQSWSSGTGTGCMTVYGVDATFKANWSNVGDYLARVGLGWNSSQTFDQLGTISADYAYTKTGSGGGFSFIGIYGWSENPLVEYYVVEDWFSSGPPTGGGTKKGSFTVDGGTYNVYQHTQTNQPAITGGNATFPQFFSVRQTPRQCGHISISEHFKEWASLGMTLGKMEEARILVEVGGGTGTIDFTTATLTAK